VRELRALGIPIVAETWTMQEAKEKTLCWNDIQQHIPYLKEHGVIQFLTFLIRPRIRRKILLFGETRKNVSS